MQEQESHKLPPQICTGLLGAAKDKSIHQMSGERKADDGGPAKQGGGSFNLEISKGVWGERAGEAFWKGSGRRNSGGQEGCGAEEVHVWSG